MDFLSQIETRLEALRASYRYRELFPTAAESFVHNDYLNLSGHPRLKQAGLAAIEGCRAGSRGSRLLGGNDTEFERAETAIAEFFGAPSALFFPTGYLANLAAVGALGAIAEEILSDEKNHASLIDGVLAARRPKRVVPHGQWSDVPAVGSPLVVTESLFSMEGDLADWDGLRRLHDRTDAFFLIDEAHGAGVFPEDGRGFARRHFSWDRMALVVTFGKAFGCAGAAVVGDWRVRDWLINTARPFVFSTATAPVLPAVARAALELVDGAAHARREVWDRAEWARGRLGLKAKDVWHRRSPILPVPLPGDEQVLAAAAALRASGFDVRPVRYPTVPVGSERIRVTVNLGVPRVSFEALIEELKCLGS